MEYNRIHGRRRSSRQEIAREVVPVKMIKPVEPQRAMSLPPTLEYLPKVIKTIPNPTRNAEKIMMLDKKPVETCYMC